MFQTNSSKIGGKVETVVRKWATNKEPRADGPQATGSFTWLDMNSPYWAKTQMQLSFERMEISQVSLDLTFTKSLFSRHIAIGFQKSWVHMHLGPCWKAVGNRPPTCGKQSGKHVGKIEEKGKLTFLTPPCLWSDLWEVPPNFIYWVTSRPNSNKQRPVRCQDICIEVFPSHPPLQHNIMEILQERGSMTEGNNSDYHFPTALGDFTIFFAYITCVFVSHMP